MRNPWKRFRAWYTEGRHLRALHRRGYAVCRADRLRAYHDRVAGFERWIEVSGALDDGTLASHTRRRVMHNVRSLALTVPYDLAEDVL